MEIDDEDEHIEEEEEEVDDGVEWLNWNPAVFAANNGLANQ
jgi:hypothetical protein